MRQHGPRVWLHTFVMSWRTRRSVFRFCFALTWKSSLRQSRFCESTQATRYKHSSWKHRGAQTVCAWQVCLECTGIGHFCFASQMIDRQTALWCWRFMIYGCSHTDLHRYRTMACACKVGNMSKIQCVGCFSDYFLFWLFRASDSCKGQICSQ